MKNLIYTLFLLTFISCYTQGYKGFDVSNATIPKSEIKDGGPPKDGIPSIDTPEFLKPSQSTLSDSDKILGIDYNGEAKAYPISIMNYHEVVNDKFENAPVAVTYCPLCGSGVAFDTKVDGKTLTFGVSGLLYNSNVLLYDRETESLWSQLKYKAVSGPLVGQKLEVISTSNTTWGDWKDKHPESLILSKDTGYNRNYDQYPYSSYKESDRLYFPVNNTNDRYHPKEMLIGIKLKGKAKAYPFTELEKIEGDFIEDRFQGKSFKVYYDSSTKSAEIQNKDNEELPSVITFWFAWYAFNPDTSVFTTE